MIRYLSLQEIYILHKAIMKAHADEGQAGIRDRGLLESALERPRSEYFGQEQYPDIYEKAAVLLDSLVNNHPFYNGNKRTAYAATKAFLKLNGHHLKMTTDEGTQFMVNIAKKHYEVPGGITHVLRKNCD